MKSGGQSDSVGVISDDPIRWSWIKISNPVLKSHWRPFERHLIEPFSGAGNSIHPARLYSAFGAIEWTIDSIKLKNIIIFRSCTKISDSRRKIYLKSLNDFIANFNISIWNESLLARFDLLWKVFFFRKFVLKNVFYGTIICNKVFLGTFIFKNIFFGTLICDNVFSEIFIIKNVFFGSFFAKKVLFGTFISKNVFFETLISKNAFFGTFFLNVFFFRNIHFQKFIFETLLPKIYFPSKNIKDFYGSKWVKNYYNWRFKIKFCARV